MTKEELRIQENTYNKGKSKQKHIEIKKEYLEIEKYKKEKKLYILLDRENFDKALSVLSPYAFQLYMYLAVNSKDYSFFLSSQHFINSCGNSQKKDRYLKSFKELKDKGFIVYNDNIDINGITYNNYYFYDKQQTIEVDNEEQINNTVKDYTNFNF